MLHVFSDKGRQAREERTEGGREGRKERENMKVEGTRREEEGRKKGGQGKRRGVIGVEMIKACYMHEQISQNEDQ